MSSLGDYDGRTILHTAVVEGNLEIVKYLLEECQVNVNPLDANKCTPMFETLLARNKQLLFYLKQQGGIIQAPKEQLTDLLLRVAKDGDLDLLQMAFYSGLKQLGDFANVDGRSIGHIAVAFE